MKKTLVDLFEESVKNYPNNTFLLEKTDKVFEPTTYAQVKEKVYQLGAGLQALGVKKGDNMALLSEGRNMWVIGELAMFYAGAANVPLSIKLEESNDLIFSPWCPRKREKCSICLRTPVMKGVSKKKWRSSVRPFAP